MVLNMEHQLKEMIVGQDDVIHKICKVIQLSKAGLRFHDRPIGVFFLLGPTVRLHSQIALYFDSLFLTIYFPSTVYCRVLEKPS